MRRIRQVTRSLRTLVEAPSPRAAAPFWGAWYADGDDWQRASRR